MKYRIAAFQGKLNSMLELPEGAVVAGVVLPQGSDDLFIIYLDPLEVASLPEEPDLSPPEEPVEETAKTDEKEPSDNNGE